MKINIYSLSGNHTISNQFTHEKFNHAVILLAKIVVVLFAGAKFGHQPAKWLPEIRFAINTEAISILYQAMDEAMSIRRVKHRFLSMGSLRTKSAKVK